MDEATRVEVEEVIQKCHGEDMQVAVSMELMSYFAHIHALKDAKSTKLLLVKDRKVSVKTFWNGLGMFPLLRSIATIVFGAACSSAAVERNFSAQQFVHSKIRNRLSQDRVGSWFICISMQRTISKIVNLLKKLMNFWRHTWIRHWWSSPFVLCIVHT